MRILCDACENAAAIVFCAADEAALCRPCDEKVISFSFLCVCLLVYCFDGFVKDRVFVLCVLDSQLIPTSFDLEILCCIRLVSTSEESGELWAEE